MLVDSPTENIFHYAGGAYGGRVAAQGAEPVLNVPTICIRFRTPAPLGLVNGVFATRAGTLMGLKSPHIELTFARTGSPPVGYLVARSHAHRSDCTVIEMRG